MLCNADDDMIQILVTVTSGMLQAGRSAEGEGAQANSDNEVELIQGRPHDGC